MSATLDHNRIIDKILGIPVLESTKTLRDDAARIVMELTGVSDADARRMVTQFESRGLIKIESEKRGGAQPLDERKELPHVRFKWVRGRTNVKVPSASP